MARKSVKQVDIDQQLGLLSETVVRIAAITSGRTEEELSLSQQPGEWSAVEILAHLRACDEVWMHSILTMLALDQPDIPAVHPRQWSKVVHYEQTAFDPSFQAFRLKRAELLKVLHGLSPEDWAKSAQIDGQTHTVFSQVRRMAQHETGHCEQIEKLFQ